MDINALTAEINPQQVRFSRDELGHLITALRKIGANDTDIKNYIFTANNDWRLSSTEHCNLVDQLIMASKL